MLQFIDGFDHYDTASIPKKWLVWPGNAGGSSSIATTIVRTGTRSLRINHSGGGSYYLSKSIPSATTVIVGLGLYADGLGSGTGNAKFLAFNGNLGNDVLHLGITTAGAITVVRGSTVLGSTADGVIPLDTWKYVEVKMFLSNTVGTVEIRVDGATVLSLTGQDTNNSTDTSITAVKVGSQPGTGGNDMYYDDLYICDNSGSLNNDFLGECKVETIYPSGAGAYTQFTPSTGANYAAVDETPGNTTDYVTSTAADQVDTYAMGNLTSTEGTVRGVQINVLATKTDSGSQKVQPVVRSGGTDEYLTELTLSYGSWLIQREVVEQNPVSDTAWTIAAINAMEAGFRSRA